MRHGRAYAQAVAFNPNGYVAHLALAGPCSVSRRRSAGRFGLW
jgi:hypothetical protein